MMRRTVILVLAFALGILVASAVPATADDVITPGPTSQPGDPFGGQTVPPGPVYIITPGVGASTLPPSSDPKDVQEQIEKDRQQASGTPGVPTATPTAASTGDPQVPGAENPASPAAVQRTSDDDGTSDSVWWAVGIGALVLVALGVVLVAASRRRDREGPDSLNEHAS